VEPDHIKRPEEKSFWVRYGYYSQLAFILPSTIFAGWIIGGLLDRWLGTTYLSMVFLLLGIAGGLIQVIRFALRDKG
jgi:F0F1-type ATP synthase assembly protein I